MNKAPLFLLGGLAALGLLAASSSTGRAHLAAAGDWMRTKIGTHFDWTEFLSSGTAEALGLKNEPTDAHAENLRALVATLLDPLRTQLSRKVHVTSGYRSPAVNEAVGGAEGSQHALGEAVDIKAEGMTATELARFILASGLPFDQMIGYPAHLGGHIHISFTRRRANRRLVQWSPTKKSYVAWNPAKGPGASA